MGNNVTIVDINEEGLALTKKLVKEKCKSDDMVFSMKIDLTNREDVRNAAKEAKTKFGDVDLLINNAGLV